MSSTQTITSSSGEANTRPVELTAAQVLEEFPDVVALGNESGSTTRPSSSDSGSQQLFEGHDEEQIKLMDEVCIALDWEDKPIGSASKKTCHIMPNIHKGLLHRAFSVFLFNDENKLLLQQRADEKITFPTMWTNTCCSHPLAIPSELGNDLPSSVEGVKRAAQRKLDQELGIVKDDIPLDKFKFLTRIHYVAPSSGAWGEHEIDYILFIRSNPNLAVNPNEVKDTCWVSPEELKEMFKDQSLLFTPWFKLICESYLFNWWNNIDTAEQFQDGKIHRML